MLSRPFHSRCHAEMCPSAAQEGRLAGKQQAHDNYDNKQATGSSLCNSCPGRAALERCDGPLRDRGHPRHPLRNRRRARIVAPLRSS